MKELPTAKFFVVEDIIEILSHEDVRKIAYRIRRREFVLSELNDLLYSFVTEGYIGRKDFLKFIYKLEDLHAYCNEKGYLH